MNDKLEIACFNLESALIAQQGGADRVELCDDIRDGGVTPSYGTAETARKLISVKLFIMIRPRAGSYVYNEAEFEQIKKDIIFFKSLKADGLVFGVLDKDGNVDVEKNKILVQLAGPLPCTFHRAFDEVNEPLNALEDVIACGYSNILTSGQKSSALEGIELLKQLSEKAAGRIHIMPGGKVRSSNIQDIRNEVANEYYHSSAIREGDTADIEEVRALKNKLKA